MSVHPGRVDASARRVPATLLVMGAVTGAGLAMLLAYALVLGFWNARTPPTRGDYVEQRSVLGAAGGAAGLVLGGLLALAFQAVRVVVAARPREDARGAPRT